MAGAASAAAARRRGNSAYRSFPDPQSRHRLRLALSRRSELGAAALSRDLGRRGRAAVAAQEARRSARGISSWALLSTAKRPDEMMVAARYPVARPDFGYAFREISRRHGDFAIVALAAVVGGGKIRLGVGGVADKPAVREWNVLDGARAARCTQRLCLGSRRQRRYPRNGPLPPRNGSPARAKGDRGGTAMRVLKQTRAPSRHASRSTASRSRASPSRACCSPISSVTRSAPPARTSAANTASAARAPFASTAGRCAAA